MTLLTAMEIANCYPEEIKIEALQHKETNKWTSMMYRLKNGEIHKLMLSFDIGENFDGFETEKEATDKMVEVAEAAIKHVEGTKNGNE